MLKPLTSLFLLIALVILSLSIILNSHNFQEASNTLEFSITLRHYGWNAEEIERRVAIPMEDALAVLSGINNITTISENNQCRVYVSFKHSRSMFGNGENYFYDAVSEAAQKVYESLPLSAQRPEINSSGNLYIPFWTAAVFGLEAEDRVPEGWMLEKQIKPVFGSIEGVAEVIISGPGVNEINVVLDRERIAAIGVSPQYIASILSSNDGFFYAGSLQSASLEIPVYVDARYAVFDADSLEDAIIPLDGGELIRLKEIAELRMQERESDIITRLNGNKVAIVSIIPASGANLALLSRELEREIAGFSALPLEFLILSDRGADEEAAFSSVLGASFEASFLLAIVIIILGLGKSSGFIRALICAATIPLIMLVSAALLIVMGFTVNGKFLAGLAIGIACAVDSVILSSDNKSHWKALVLGAVTSIASLLPILNINENTDINIIAYAIGSVTLVSVFLALTLLPPIFIWEKSIPKVPNVFFSKVSTALQRKKKLFNRSAAIFSYSCNKYALLVIFTALILTSASLYLLVSSDINTVDDLYGDTVYVQIEFEGGFLKSEADILLALWAEELLANGNIKQVQTGARVGNAYAIVKYDIENTNVDEIKNFIRSLVVPGAFIYFPEAAGKDNLWRITISGDEAEKCRDYAMQAAYLLSFVPEVKETVLHFKEGTPRLNLFPLPDILSYGGLSFSYASDFIRWGVQGPVAYKRTSENGDTDLRISFEDMLSVDDVLTIPLPNNLSISSFMDAEVLDEYSVIYRENRRRSASFSIRTAGGDPRYYRNIVMEELRKIPLAAGYRIEFDLDAVEKAEAVSQKFFSFIWAVLFCYMLIAAMEESFILPLIVLSLIPPSMAVPVLIICLLGIPLNTSVACALVVVCGIAVNSSVLICGDLYSQKRSGKYVIYAVIKKRVLLLSAMTLTTIIGSLPFLFLNDVNGFIRNLGLITVFGVSSSFIFSITLIPVLMNMLFKNTHAVDCSM